MFVRGKTVKSEHLNRNRKVVKKMKDQLEVKELEIEELEERIAPSGFGPSNNGNPGNEVSNGAKPHPSGHGN